MQGQVDMVEPLGDHSDLHVLVDGQRVVVQLSAQVKVQEGEPLTLHLDLERLHLFDPVTGTRLQPR
jgi:ABC-type sugar transport system ATPase subunit